MDRGLLTGAVFSDLRKAYDTVHHQQLIEKLSRCGIRDGNLIWFQDYLLDRKQMVMFHAKLLIPHIITTGVPQGSVLAPLLLFFTLCERFINGIEPM